MIHPMALVFAIIVIMAGLFAVVYIAIQLYTQSEEQRLRLEQNRYGTSVEVKAGADYSVRFRPGLNSDTAPTVFLSVSNPPSHGVQVATMGSPAEVTLEIDAQAFDDIAVAWIKYRDLAGAVTGTVGNEIGSINNP